MSAVLTFAQSGIGPVTSAVPQARHHIAHPPTLIAPQYKLKEIVNGFAPLENPSGIITNFGFLNDFPPQPIEATKTEADENTYLVFNDNPGGRPKAMITDGISSSKDTRFFRAISLT